MARKILIVDDNPIERKLLSEIISDEFNVIEAESGKEAINKLIDKGNVISAIMLDLILPDIDGYEVLRRISINALWSQIPVIVCSALQDEETQDRVIKLGAYGITSKPYNSSMLHNSLRNCIRLRESSALVNSLKKDKLTGIYNRENFLSVGEKMISGSERGYFTLSSLDIENFKVINDQYGTENGDMVLKHIAKCLLECSEAIDGICCRVMADKFAILFPTKFIDSDYLGQMHRIIRQPDCIEQKVKIRIGRYLVEDKSVPISSMYDRATMAQESIKGRFDAFIVDYNDEMREKLINEQRVVTQMHEALSDGQFVSWFQPQFNHATGTIIGAEALVRWRKPDGSGFVSPGEFIPIFERNGFIYEMDKNIWEQACSAIRKCMDGGYEAVPISVNVSRHDIFHDDFYEVITGLVEKYEISADSLKLEITESAFSTEPKQIVDMVKKLIKYGFTVEIDDFGSGYSSLNTLKDVPAHVLKLDMRFLTNQDNSQRGGSIIESVVRMAKWLGMMVIAEGVEEREQADFLKSIGCYYIQGFYYAKPMPFDKYTDLLGKKKTEKRKSSIQTIEYFDSSAFWDPKSMDTLIFNSYVGGASIFEYHDGKTEVLRATESFVHEFGFEDNQVVSLDELNPENVLDSENLKKLYDTINNAIQSHRESSCEVIATPGIISEASPVYLRTTVRVIARTEDRFLCYSVIVNITNMREAENREHIASQQIRAIMDNADCGITAVVFHENEEADYLFVNDRYYELLGFTKEQYRNEIKTSFELINPIDAELIVDKIVALKNVGESEVFNFRAKRRDGKEIWLRCAISVVSFDTVDCPVQLSCFTDITSELEADVKLQSILKNAETGITAITIKNGKNEIIFANDKFYEILGYTSQNYHDCVSNSLFNIHPDDREEVMKKITDSYDKRYNVCMEYRVIRSDGKIIWLKTQLTMADMGYDIPIQLATHIDITEEKNNVDLLENLPCGAVLLDLGNDGEIKVVHTNTRYSQLVNRDTAYYSDIAVYDIIHPDDRENVKREIADAIKEKRTARCDLRILGGDKLYSSFRAIANIVPKKENGYFVYATYIPICEMK